MLLKRLDNMDKLIEFDNGLRLCLKKDISVYSVNVLFSVECGAFYPKTQKVGVAHMLEHNILSDSDDKELSLNEELGKIGTLVEAYTYDFNTVYSIRTFNEYLPLCINLLYNKIFNAKFGRPFFEKEKSVIYKEYLKQRNNVMPANAFIASEKFYSGTIIENSGYGIGTKKQIDNITFDDMVDFYNNYYTKSRTTMVIAGNFQEEQVLTTVNKLIEKENEKTKHISFIEQDIAFYNENQIKVIGNNEKLGSTCVEIVFSACNELYEKKWIYECLALMLSGLSTSSLLKDKLRNQLGYIYNCDASLDSSICYKNCGTLNIRYYVDNRYVENSIIECFKIIKQLRTEVNKNLLAYAKISLINNLKIKLENIEKVCSFNAQNLMLFGCLFDIKKEIATISKISEQDIQKCIEHMVSHMKVISIMGKKVNEKKLERELSSIF